MKRTQRKKLKIFVNRSVISAVVLLCAAGAAAFSFAGCSVNQDMKLSLLDFGTITQGVRIAGIDVSGMTQQQAIEATSGVPDKLLGEIKIPIDVNGKILTLSAKEAGLDTDYEDAVANALSYGHFGAIGDRAEAASAAMNGAVDFAVTVTAKKENVEAAIFPLKEKLDKAPVDAECKFTPKGHNINGAASGQIERIPAGEMPNKLRYKYYRTSKYVKNYIPSGAGISRFIYTKEEDGLEVDIRSVAVSVLNAAAKGDYSTIKAPAQALKPAITLDAVKYQTQLISSFTSSYESHNGSARNYNVAKLSGIINGVVIKPGEIWSINEEAGPRTYDRGWKGAAGIKDGAFITEPGGGVCQLSSTTYNAALRAGLEIVESSRHSVISNYMPLGLDATISTGGKDLKVRNPYSTPVFIVSYVNKKEKNVTVEFYGPPVTDGTHGQVILDFSSKFIERFGSPNTEVHYNASETPDGKPIAEGSSKNFVTARRGTRAQVYIHYISPDGKELEKKKLYVAVYPKINGQKYVNGAPP